MGFHAFTALVFIPAATEALILHQWPAAARTSGLQTVCMQQPDHDQAAMVGGMMTSAYTMGCTAFAFFKSSDMTKVCTYLNAFEKTGNATFNETATTLKESWVWADPRASYAYAAAGVCIVPFFAFSSIAHRYSVPALSGGPW